MYRVIVFKTWSSPLADRAEWREIFKVDVPTCDIGIIMQACIESKPEAGGDDGG